MNAITIGSRARLGLGLEDATLESTMKMLASKVKSTGFEKRDHLNKMLKVVMKMYYQLYFKDVMCATI